jgi:hypothetical protein
MRLIISVTGESSKAELFSRPFPSTDANKPLWFSWPAAASPNGWYRVVATGYTLISNEEVNEVVHFYHSRKLGQ